MNFTRAVESESRMCIIDVRGTPVVEEYFDDAKDVSEGYAAVQVDRQWGFIDFAGRWSIEPRFARLKSLSEGLAGAKNSGNGLFGYVDFKGDWKIEPQFQVAYPFVEGRAVVEFPDETWAFIDRIGNLVARIEGGGSEFSHGLLVEQVEESDSDSIESSDMDADYMPSFREGFLDRWGKWAIPPIYGGASSFSCGLAWVVFDNDQGRVTGAIDRHGNLVFEPIGWRLAEHSHRTDFWYGRAIAQVGEELVVIDKHGRTIKKLNLDPNTTSIDEFRHGLARVRLIQRPGWKEWSSSAVATTGFLNADGEWKVDPKYEGADRFQSGLARVETGGESFYIDTHGDVVWRCDPSRADLIRQARQIAGVIARDGNLPFLAKAKAIIVGGRREYDKVAGQMFRMLEAATQSQENRILYDLQTAFQVFKRGAQTLLGNERFYAGVCAENQEIMIMVLHYHVTIGVAPLIIELILRLCDAIYHELGVVIALYEETANGPGEFIGDLLVSSDGILGARDVLSRVRREGD